MSVMTGLDFLTESKRDPLFARTPVVVVTARGGGGAALQLDADAVISKFFDADLIFRLVNCFVARVHRFNGQELLAQREHQQV